MSARPKTRRGLAAFVGIALTAVLASCGDDDFKNEPRPPLPVELTGVIQTDKITISPRSVGAGPVLITISNQTDDPHSVLLEGNSLRSRSPSVAPTDTTTIRETLEPGEYEVSAGSAAAVPREIRAARLDVGAERASSSDDLLLP